VESPVARLAWLSSAKGRYYPLMANPPNSLDLLGKRVRYQGKEGLVVGRLDPLAAHRDRLAPFRGESVTIRIEGHLGPTFVEVAAIDLGGVEVLEG
jgi:hypothetical protein